MKVLLIAPAPPPYGGMALQAQQLERLLIGDGVTVLFLASNFSLPGPLGRLERVRGVRTLLRAGLIWFKLSRRVRQVEVVHILAASWLFFFIVVYPAVILGRAYGKRVVVNYRSGEAKDFFRKYGWMAAPALKLASVITAPSEFIASVVRERFDMPVAVVPNILDASLFQYRPRTNIRPRLLVTRHLEKLYDIESVIKAFGVVQSRYPDASLRIAGDGSQEAHLRDLVAALNLTNVQFLGAVAHCDLPAVYEECDIYVNASLADNFPGALIEASAAGLVVVTTRAGGIPFIYEDGRTAVLVEPGDWRGLAAAVDRVLQHPAEALEMTKAAVAVVRACDWTEVRPRLLESYGFSMDAAPVGAARLKGIGAPAEPSRV